MPPGAYGALAKKGNDLSILVSDRCFTEGFRRFTIAHELGHVHLDGHVLQLFNGDVGKHYSASGQFRGISKPWYELEADAFASELLSPEFLVRPFLRDAGRGVDAVKRLADAFNTSLSSAAVRYAQLADDGVAVILSYRGVVEWSVCSRAMREHWWGRRTIKREWAPRNSATAVLSRSSARVLAQETLGAEGWLMEWFEGAPPMSIEEEATGLGEYGRILTVIECGRLPSPERMREKQIRDERAPTDWRDQLRTYKLDSYEDVAEDD